MAEDSASIRVARRPPHPSRPPTANRTRESSSGGGWEMKRAYVTLLCGGDGYLPGVEVLGRSLEVAGAKAPRVVLTTPDVTSVAREGLRRLGWEVRNVEAIANPASALLFPRFKMVFTKLRAWELDDIERVVLLDADTLVLKNIDDLFERRTFAAAPDFFLPDRFNSGVMVLDPSRLTFRRMVERLSNEANYDGGDQGFLNRFYPDWYAMPESHRLPMGYNMATFSYQFMHAHPLLKDAVEKEIRIIHYMLQKPWQTRALVTGGAEVWWELYFQIHPQQGARWRQRMHALEDLAFERVIGGLLG